MMLSPTASHALALLTAIAHHATPERPVGAAALVERYGLSKRALEPMLQRLARLKLIASVRGAQGGYYVPEPNALSVGDVLRALEEKPLPLQQLRPLQPVLEAAFSPLAAEFLARCDAIPIASLAERAAQAGIEATLLPVLDFDI